MGPRLAEPGNAVRFEVETAVALGVTVACVRVDGAPLPLTAELPPLLADLPGWDSPQVHADAAIADIERIIKGLTGRSPGELPWVDRWDLLIAVLLGLLGLAAWYSVAQTSFNLPEAWLWGMALIMPWLLWMIGRRLSSAAGRGRPGLRFRQAAVWGALLAVFGGSWVWAHERLYAWPTLPSDVGGILVARLAGDQDDRAQGKLIERFRRDQLNIHGADETVLRLPRRIGFSLWRRGPSEDGHDDARKHGARSGAAVVLWGRLQPAEERLSLNLTFIEGKALFSTKGAEVVGGMGRRELSSLEGDLGLLADMLPRLLNGYRRYHAARDTADFDGAEDDFQKAIASLEKRASLAPRDRRALDEILGSLHFYRANTLAILGRTDEAVRAYGAAIDQTARDENGVKTPQYIEAASNQGWLLLEQGKLDEALAVLTSVAEICEQSSKLRACAYVWYNLGSVRSYRREHQLSGTLFKRASELIEVLLAPETEDRRLEAHALQYRSYSLVRQAEGMDEDSAAPLLAEAEAAWKRGVEALSRTELKVPDYFRLTRARIHIERREWKQAIEMLSPLQVPSDRAATRHALLAGAYYCIGNALPHVTEHLNGLTKTGLRGKPPVGWGITTDEGMKTVSRINRMCKK